MLRPASLTSPSLAQQALLQRSRYLAFSEGAMLLRPRGKEACRLLLRRALRRPHRSTTTQLRIPKCAGIGAIALAPSRQGLVRSLTIISHVLTGKTGIATNPKEIACSIIARVATPSNHVGSKRSQPRQHSRRPTFHLVSHQASSSHQFTKLRV